MGPCSYISLDARKNLRGRRCRPVFVQECEVPEASDSLRRSGCSACAPCRYLRRGVQAYGDPIPGGLSQACSSWLAGRRPVLGCGDRVLLSHGRHWLSGPWVPGGCAGLGDPGVSRAAQFLPPGPYIPVERLMLIK